jgi:8-oxo-dGTP pyrophosphatase MutT (NUDIX family)
MPSIESTATTTADLRTAIDLPQRLAAALGAGIRGATARVRMSPELSYGRHAGPAPYTARRAAVTLLLFRRAGRWHIPLTERPPTLARHAGQISLPGGAIDPGESSRDTALRELAEELGLSANVTILGQLADCYIFASDFLVTPWLTATTDDPTWTPHDCEVQSIIELPLETLLDDTAIGRTAIKRGLLTFRAPCINIGNARVWGATSAILGELADVLRVLMHSNNTTK